MKEQQKTQPLKPVTKMVMAILTIKDNVVIEMAICTDEEHHHNAFLAECGQYDDYKPNDVDFERGYVHFDCGHVVQMLTTEDTIDTVNELISELEN